MGNIIVSNDFITVGDSYITVQSTAAGFAKANVMNLTNLKRRYRMDSADKSAVNPIMRFDLGATKTVAAVVIDDCNFSRCIILGGTADHGTDWSGATYVSSAITISNDEQVNRWKAYIPIATTFDYRYLAIAVATTATACGTYTTKWEVGRVAILDSVYTFQKNMSRGYQRGAEKPYEEVVLKNGHAERQSVGDIKWTGTLTFDYRAIADEVDLTTLNNMDIGQSVVFYENSTQTNAASKVYIAVRDDNYIGTMESGKAIKCCSIRLRERV